MGYINSCDRCISDREYKGPKIGNSAKVNQGSRYAIRIASGARSLETHGEAPVGRFRLLQSHDANPLTNRRATEEVPPQISVCTAIWQGVAVPAQSFGVVSVPGITCRSGQMTIRFLEWVWMEGERRFVSGTNATLWYWTLVPEIGWRQTVFIWPKLGNVFGHCHRQMGHFPSTIMKRSCGPVEHFVSLLPSTDVLKKCRPWSLHRA